jgi:DNA-binding MarR family transcriptional regulator
MTYRKNQIENLIQMFHVIRRKTLTGTVMLSPQNQIPNSQWIILHAVFHNEGIGIKELSNILGISSSAATQLVDSLVKQGHLVRQVSPDDRRALKIWLSVKTKKAINKSKIEAFAKVDSLFDVLSDEELQTYCDLSKKIIDRILNQ